ncbi:MAG: hypothetical protein LAO56_17425 [Acidobacteriia bacterium]|nr:hypothetical protein [Terriglobia bacterium]
MNRQLARIGQFFGILILLSAVLTSLTWADDDDDPPGRVARMNYAQGSVSFQPGGEGDWVEAVPNRPLTAGDNLWTDRDTRAELHVGSTAIRLGSETSLTFLELDDNTLQLRLAQGTALLRVRHMDDNDTIEIDTPNLAFRIQRNGEYRVDVDPDGHGTVIDVFQGRGEAVGAGNTYTLVANQHATFTGDDNLDYDIDPLPAPDGFDEWAMSRDRREDDDRSANYVSREMTGYEDLDDNGRWSYTANYGPVWVPTNVPMGWAPYRFGHWVWVAPWGWTWVDDQPWGFAPFHYGRWCVVGGGWAWVPGPVVVRPVYAPALVAFAGGGGFHFSVSFGGGGGVAWFPLGPGEVFVPGYHVSRRYVNQVNVTNTVVNVTKVTNVYNNYTTNNTTEINRITYVNRARPGAVTVVSRETFVNARPVARNVVSVPQREIEQAPVSHIAQIDPIRTSVMGAGRPTRVAPPPAVVHRQVVAERPPAQPTVPFNQRRDPLVARPVRSGAQPVNSEPIHTQPNRPGPEPTTSPNQPAIRPEWQTPRPGATPTRPETPRAETPRSETPRPETPRADTPRPETARPITNNEPRPEQGWSHPQAKPAPPVHEKTPQQAQQEERKYQRWEQQSKPEQRPKPQAPRPAEKDKKDKDKHR